MSATRRTTTSADRADLTYLQIGALAREAMASEWIAADAGADAVTEVVRRQILGHGYRLTPPGQQFETAPGLIGVQLDQGVAYPAFQFADRELVHTHAALADVNEILAADSDPIGALSWWWSPNTWLGTQPAFLLGTEREPELAHAARQLYNDSW